MLMVTSRQRLWSVYVSEREFEPSWSDLAETELQRAAQLAGGNVNRTTSDRYGWDCAIEFPPLRSDLPADLAPPGLMILAQVKSNRAGDLTCRLSLSNALKYVRHPLPYFIVLVGYRGGAEQPAIYVKHVWEPLFERILKAVRKADSEGAALNHGSIVIHFDESERADADAVKVMARTVDSLGPSYTATKSAIVGATGYDNVIGHGQVTLRDDVDLATLVDAALGLIPSVEVERFTVRDKRFGMVGKNPLLDVSGGRLSIAARRVAECTLTLRRNDTREEISLQGEVFAPSIPNLPPEYWKLLISTPIFGIGLRLDDQSSSDFSTTIYTDKDLPFSRLIEATALWSWLGRYPLTLQVWMDGRVVTEAQLGIDVEKGGGNMAVAASASQAPGFSISGCPLA